MKVEQINNHRGILLHCEQILKISRDVILKLRGTRLKAVEKKQEAYWDITTEADLAVEKAVIKYLRKNLIPVKLVTEEQGEVDIVKEPKYLLTLDPLDGSLNASRGFHILPYSTTLALFDNLQPKYGGVIFAGTFEHQTGVFWTARKNDNCFRLGKTKCQVSHRKNLSGAYVCIDYYAGQEYSLEEVTAFKPVAKSARVVDFCTSAFQFALIADGVLDAYISKRQKAHELGPAYLLIKEAGGVIVNFSGKDIGNLPYDFSGRVPMIAACSYELAQKIIKECNLNLLRRRAGRRGGERKGQEESLKKA